MWNSLYNSQIKDGLISGMSITKQKAALQAVKASKKAKSMEDTQKAKTI